MSTTNGYIDAVRFPPSDEAKLRLRDLLMQAILSGPTARKAELAKQAEARRDVSRRHFVSLNMRYGKSARPTPEALESASPGQSVEVDTTLQPRRYVIRVHHA